MTQQAISVDVKRLAVQHYKSAAQGLVAFDSGYTNWAELPCDVIIPEGGKDLGGTSCTCRFSVRESQFKPR